MSHPHSQASRRKRPYLTPIVSLVLLGFLVYIAITSWNYQPPAGNPIMAGQVIYLPVIEKGVCTHQPCPVAPSATPYP